MAREVRTIEEFFEGPQDDPSDRWARGRLAAILAEAREADQVELLIECRTTPAGTTSSDKLFHVFVRATDEPLSVATAVRARLEEALDDAFAGQVRLVVRDRTTSSHVGSFARTMRPGPPLSTTVGQVGQAGLVVIREPDAVRPWVDMTMRVGATMATLLNSAAELVKAAQPPQPANGQAALLQALTQFGAATSAPAPAPAAAAPPPAAVPSQGRPSWPLDGPSRPALPAPQPSVSLLEDQAAGAERPLTLDEVRRWAIANPDGARELVREAIASGAGL